MSAIQSSEQEHRSFLMLLAAFSLVIAAVFAWRYGSMIADGAADAIFAHDFAVFYVAAQVFTVWPPSSPYFIQTGEALLAHVAANQYHPYLNPPFLVFALWPLQGLFYETARLWFLAMQVALWILVLHVPSVRALWPNLSRQKNYSWLVLAISLPFAVNTLMVGQLGIAYGALLLLGAGLLPTRPVLAGVVWALVACKPTLALLLPFVLVGGRQWRACAAFVATGLFLTLAATAVWGMDIWREWLQAVQIHNDVMQQTELPHKFAAQMISLYAGLRLVGVDTAPALAAQATAFAACILAVTLFAWQKRPLSAQAAMLFASVFVASGYVLQYDAMILAAAMLVLLDAPRTAFTRLGLILLVSSGAIVPQLQAMQFPAGTLIILLFWLVCLRNIRLSAP